VRDSVTFRSSKPTRTRNSHGRKLRMSFRARLTSIRAIGRGKPRWCRARGQRVCSSVSSRVFCNEDANESQTDALDEPHSGRTWPLPPHPHRASRTACLMYVAFPPTLRFPAVAGMQQGRYTCTLLRATHPKRMRRRLGSWDLFAIYCTLLRMDSFALYSHGLALTH